MNDSELLERADLNLMEFCRHGARFTAGGIVNEEAGLLFFVPGHRFPVGFTGVMRSDSSVAPAEVIERTHAFFAPLGCGYTFGVMTHRDGDIIEALEASGTMRFGNSPGMALDRRLDDPVLGAGVTIERVETPQQARDFSDVSGTAYATYGMPTTIAELQFADLRFFTQPHVAAFLARVDGTPAAAAMVLVTHGVAGIYWVGTTPQARGRGLAEAVTRMAGNAGFDMGADVAALQASVMGEPVYLRMGYREITRYPWFTVMP